MFNRARIGTLVLLVGAALAVSSGAYAQSPATATLNVRANVAKNCTVAASPLAFPDYDTLSETPATANTALSVTCTRGVEAEIGLSNGTNADGTTRRMRLGTSSDYLTYELFQDSSLTARWGTGGEAYAWTSPNRSAHSLTVYGRIPAGQDAAAGSGYADSIQVTVNY